ncbi:RGSL protein, partial [Urocolius indicus]|nr:RGSL protein [Urocolius indicus]
AATAACTDLELLLRDDVFVDFFNTFLNLPVFGQTPIYIISLGRWDLWPELPSHLDPSPPAFLAWLKKHRLPHFCKSSLWLQLGLCQKLLGFIRSGEAAKLFNWRSADQWLLEKCISRSQGMWHFRAFVSLAAGEELINFWLSTERLLGLDESDVRQRDLHLSLLQRLKATHLREGSSVTTLCRTIIESQTKARHDRASSTRREILSKMQEQALFIIQSYWLPKFFTHCKKGMEEEKSCWPLLQEYGERLLQANPQEPSGLSESLLPMRIKRSQGLSGPYCSKKAKEELWALIKKGRDTQEMKVPSVRVQAERQPGPGSSTKESCLDKDALGSVHLQPEHLANAAFGGKGRTTSPKRHLHLENTCEERGLSNLHSSAPLVQLPPSKDPTDTLSFLPWALSADTCAGRPFRDFLKHQDRSVETRLLDLWHDLEEFLPVVLDLSRENGFFLRQLTGEKICKTYLEESSIHQLPLETRTLRSLRNHLMVGEFSSWIFRAQEEICKVLCCSYEEFLADDDRTFLQFMAPPSDVPVPEVQGHTLGKDEGFLLYRRINQSLKLSQALHGTRNLGGISSKHWQLIATRDLWQGGSIQAEVEPLLCSTDSQKTVPNELAAQKPSPAVDSPGKENDLQCLKSPSLAAEPKTGKKRTAPGRKTRSSKTESSTVAVEKPSGRPRHFVKVLHNPAHLQFFRQFLKERRAEQPLCFWMAVEKLVAETNPKTKKSLMDSIVRKYFHAEIPAEELLDCHTSIIKEIKEAEVVSPFMLVTAQLFVQKAMEKRWFEEYQELFPPSESQQSDHLRHGMGNFTRGKSSQGWCAIHHIIRSICKFRREMNNAERRAEFEDFLRRERGNKEESMA